MDKIQGPKSAKGLRDIIIGYIIISSQSSSSSMSAVDGGTFWFWALTIIIVLAIAFGGVQYEFELFLTMQLLDLLVHELKTRFNIINAPL